MIRLPREALSPSVPLSMSASVQIRLDEPKVADYANTQAAARAWLSMREELAEAQGRKCGWCESLLEQRAIEIDHIRPKSRQCYWWLAFDLDNLLAACTSCNNFKRDLWPLEPGARPLRPRQSPRATQERSMIVDPTVEDPSKHITFTFEGGSWRIAGLTRRGREAITVLQLDRTSLAKKINYHAQHALDPLVRELQAALAADDLTAYLNAGRHLAAFAHPSHPWSALNLAVYKAALSDSYRP